MAAVAKSGVLHSVRVVQCPALTSAAARIMAESSPMYAWIDDTVPKKLYVLPVMPVAFWLLPLRCSAEIVHAHEANSMLQPGTPAAEWSYERIYSLMY